MQATAVKPPATADAMSDRVEVMTRLVKVEAFYARRQGAPLWLGNGLDSDAAREFMTALRRSPLDGFASATLSGTAGALAMKPKRTGQNAKGRRAGFAALARAQGKL